MVSEIITALCVCWLQLLTATRCAALQHTLCCWTHPAPFLIESCSGCNVYQTITYTVATIGCKRMSQHCLAVSHKAVYIVNVGVVCHSYLRCVCKRLDVVLVSAVCTNWRAAHWPRSCKSKPLLHMNTVDTTISCVITVVCSLHRSKKLLQRC
jgi:hypothetical protein